MEATISKEAAERLKKCVSKYISKQSILMDVIKSEIDSMTEPEAPPPHEWKAGEWAYWKNGKESKTFKVTGLHYLWDELVLETDGMKPGIGGYMAYAAVPISAPLYEIGMRVKHSTHSFKILKRKWDTILGVWVYLDDSGSDIWHTEFALKLAPEWEKGMRAYDPTKVPDRIFEVLDIKNGQLWNGWRWFNIADCRHVYHLQIEGQKCICGQMHKEDK